MQASMDNKSTTEIHSNQPLRPLRPTGNTDLCVCNDQSIHDTVVYQGRAKIYLDATSTHKSDVQFKLINKVNPLSQNRKPEWSVEFDEGTFEQVPHKFMETELMMWKRVVEATVIAAAGRKPLDNSTDIIYVDQVILYRIQRFPAWLTLGSKTYEVDIIKKSNGVLSWDVEVITECDEAMATLIEETVLVWAKKNPVGQAYKQDNIEE